MAKIFLSFDRVGCEGADEKWLGFVLEAVLTLAQANPLSELGVSLVDDERMRQLNLSHRQLDEPTDALAFAYREIQDFSLLGAEEEGNYLGDIYLSRESIARGAQTKGVSEKQELTYLFVHGLLHLLGFDHQLRRQAEAMEKLEGKIMATL